ncbi:MAG: cytochrome c peroxidase [Bacteroidota bacterium]
MPLLLALLFWGCEPAQPFLPASDVYRVDLPAGFPEMPVIPGNELTQSRVELGKLLFFDPAMSRDRTISCGSCHFQEYGFSDPVPLSIGVDGRKSLRNSSPLVNLAWRESFFRDGGVRTLELQVLAPITDHLEMDFTIQGAVERMKENPQYVQLSRAAYGREPDAFVLTRAISAYERTLISGNSRYDRYTNYGESVLTAQELRGMELFFSERTNCGGCHGGFNLSNEEFANNGRYVAGADSGRMRVTQFEGDRGRFKVPTLRNIAETFPYMSDGELATLDDVVEHYRTGIVPHPNLSPLIPAEGISITDSEKADLVAFLGTFSDAEFLGK